MPTITCRGGKMPIAIQVPKTPAQLDQVRALMRSFIAWHKERHGEDIHLIRSEEHTSELQSQSNLVCRLLLEKKKKKKLYNNKKKKKKKKKIKEKKKNRK